MPPFSQTLISCTYCGNQFQVKRYRTKTAKYCSRRCLRLGTEENKGIKKVCKTCNKQFYVSILRKDTAKYCSRTCYYKAKYGSIEIVCPVCDKTFKRSPSHTQKHCSPRCKNIALRQQKASHANGAVKKINKMGLRERCCACGYSKYPQILEVHHIDHHRSNNDWSNLTLLCPNCHKINHFVQPLLLVSTIADLMREVGLTP